MAEILTPELIHFERRPEVGIIRIINKAKVSRKFNSVVHSLDFGSVTVTIRINGSPVPGLVNLVPGTESFRAVATGGNILEVDKSLEIVLSRLSTPRGLSLQFEYDWII